MWLEDWIITKALALGLLAITAGWVLFVALKSQYISGVLKTFCEGCYLIERMRSNRGVDLDVAGTERLPRSPDRLTRSETNDLASGDTSTSRIYEIVATNLDSTLSASQTSSLCSAFDFL